ncbi:hypothetical protein [Kibdelosporangium persicum]|uniref:hypothetical protein n=1 Tax=Kibdelosporangium persicum TaxID=2698649 RepID=UPI001FED0107|nr:hypothetical protein [Kibdelosporangium persicum]
MVRCRSGRSRGAGHGQLRQPIDPVQQRLGAESRGRGGQEFDRQWQPVGPPAKPYDGIIVLPARGRRWCAGGRQPLGEEPHGRRRGQRGDADLAFPTHPQRNAAGGQDHRAGTGRQQFGQLRSAGGHTLQVVQNEQDRRPVEVRGEAGHGVGVGSRRAGDGGEDVVGVSDVGEVGEERPARVVPSHRPRRQQRNGGLADPAGAGERHQPARRGTQGGEDLGDLVVPPDHRDGWRRRRVGRQRAGRHLKGLVPRPS